MKTKNQDVCKCGHKRPETIILDSNELSVAFWMQYWEQRGELCWDCFCKKFVPQKENHSQRTNGSGRVKSPLRAEPSDKISAEKTLNDISSGETPDTKTPPTKTGFVLPIGKVNNSVKKEFRVSPDKTAEKTPSGDDEVFNEKRNCYEWDCPICIAKMQKAEKEENMEMQEEALSDDAILKEVDNWYWSEIDVNCYSNELETNHREVLIKKTISLTREAERKKRAEAVKKLKEDLFGKEIVELNENLENHKKHCINGCAEQQRCIRRLKEINKPFEEIFGEELGK